MDGERAALHAQYAAALEALAREAAAAGDADAAVREWRRLAAAEPLSSRIALALMQALAGAGDRAALQATAVHTVLVREELDAAPDAAVLAYAQELRREGEAAASAAPASAPAGDRAAFAGRVAAHTGALLEPDAAARAAASVISGRFYLAGDTVWLQADRARMSPVRPK